MIYAPQTKDEVAIVMEIIKAASGWISGDRFSPEVKSDIDGNQHASDSLIDHECIDNRLITLAA